MTTTTSDDAAHIRLQNVRFAYPGSAFRLEIPALAIDRGERLACVGASGCGKTTLMHLIAGILSPDQGTVSIGASVISDLADAPRRALRAGRMGLVFQSFELLASLTALENILLPFHVGVGQRVDRAARDRARTLAGDLGIDHVVARRPDRLSQGERQRVAMARALVNEPELLLCDEPTGNLDPANAERLLDLLLEQARARNATVLVVTHDHTTLDRFDRVIDMAGIGVAS